MATPSAATSDFPPPPQGVHQSFDNDDAINYVRDPHKLIAYLVPFPTPEFKKGLFHAASGKDVPQRFLIYTPPPPPLSTPAEGDQESKAHKLQRKWQAEVREAKTNPQKLKSWKGIKGRVTKGISSAMNWTTNANLDFVNRIPNASGSSTSSDSNGDHEDLQKTVGLEEMVLFYPDNLSVSEETIRQEFLENMLRTKSKSEKDAVLASGLLPVAAAVDICATLVWPFGGALEIDGAWAYASIRGAKTARSVTKRLASSTKDGDADDMEQQKLQLTFTASPRINILQKYLQAECHNVDSHYFSAPRGVAPTETEVLEAIGWSPSQSGGETKNWEDEQWETSEVKEDVKGTMHKGAKEWDKWVKKFEKDPEKVLKK